KSSKIPLTTTSTLFPYTTLFRSNPRMAYFPYVQPQRNYAVQLRAALPAQGGATLGADMQCAVQTDAMPPSFYFASRGVVLPAGQDRKSTRLNSSHVKISYAVFCL